jgi:hypothetical protein
MPRHSSEGMKAGGGLNNKILKICRPHLNPPLRGEEAEFRISNKEFRISNGRKNILDPPVPGQDLALKLSCSLSWFLKSHQYAKIGCVAPGQA